MARAPRRIRGREDDAASSILKTSSYLCGMLQERADVASIVRNEYAPSSASFKTSNLLQARLLDLWLGGRHDIVRRRLTIAQTICSFTGASPDYPDGFRAGTRVRASWS